MTIESFESSQISNQFTLLLYEVLVVKAHAQRDHQLDGLLVILTTERFHASEGTLGHDSGLKPLSPGLAFSSQFTNLGAYDICIYFYFIYFRWLRTI